ncbi:MAG: (d)CMP kinase [Bacillota bacterium]
MHYNRELCIKEEGGFVGIVIAIDGPAGAGKSTISKILANKLGFRYLDTGAMYRAITYLALKKDINISNYDEINNMMENIEICFYPPQQDGKSHIVINEEDVTDKIRTTIIDQNVSAIAKIKIVRESMVKIQRSIAEYGNIIMDGRDIGSRVLPDADYKFFITASLEERARRRFLDIQKKSDNISYEEVKNKIAHRDKIDTERKISPLIKATDAVLIDTTNFTIEKAVEKILDIVKDERYEKTSI